MDDGYIPKKFAVEVVRVGIQGVLDPGLEKQIVMDTLEDCPSKFLARDCISREQAKELVYAQHGPLSDEDIDWLPSVIPEQKKPDPERHSPQHCVEVIKEEVESLLDIGLSPEEVDVVLQAIMGGLK